MSSSPGSLVALVVLRVALRLLAVSAVTRLN